MTDNEKSKNIKKTNLEDYRIEKLIDQKKRIYYILVHTDNGGISISYFCFPKQTEGWDIIKKFHEEENTPKLTLEFEETEREKNGFIQIFRKVLNLTEFKEEFGVQELQENDLRVDMSVNLGLQGINDIEGEVRHPKVEEEPNRDPSEEEPYDND